MSLYLLEWSKAPPPIEVGWIAPLGDTLKLIGAEEAILTINGLPSAPSGSGSGGGANLTYLPDISSGNIISDTGTDATLPPVDNINAGLMLPAQKNKLDLLIQGVSGFCGGRPVISEVVLSSIAPYPHTITQANSSAKAQIAATSSTVFQVKKNGANVMTFTFAPGDTVATTGAVSNATVATGDVVTVTAPSVPDATLADIAFLIRQ